MNLENEFKKYASRDAFFYITLDPERALGIEDILPNYTIICPYKSWLIDDLKKTRVNTFVLEEKMVIRDVEKIVEKGSYGMMKSEIVKDYISGKCAGSNPPHSNVGGWTPHINLRPNILVLKTSTLIEELCKEQEWDLLAPQADLAEKFENKISQFKTLKNALKYPKSYLTFVAGIHNKKSGYPFVLQFNRGHSGNSTFFIKSSSDLEKLYKLYPKREAKISEFIKGKTYTLNCLLLMGGEIVTGSISEQITGLKEATNNPNTTVGNDWGSARKLVSRILSEIKGMAEKAGKALWLEGYRGMFGIDVIVEEKSGNAYLIELNTHQPASISFEAKIHRKTGKIPLIALFILDQCGKLDIDNADLPPLVLAINAKQIIYRNKDLKNITRNELIEKYKDKGFTSRLYSVKPNEEVRREQVID